jgi:hypothetical protein
VRESIKSKDKGQRVKKSGGSTETRETAGKISSGFARPAALCTPDLRQGVMFISHYLCLSLSVLHLLFPFLNPLSDQALYESASPLPRVKRAPPSVTAAEWQSPAATVETWAPANALGQTSTPGGKCLANCRCVHKYFYRFFVSSLALNINLKNKRGKQAHPMLKYRVPLRVQDPRWVGGRWEERESEREVY